MKQVLADTIKGMKPGIESPNIYKDAAKSAVMWPLGALLGALLVWPIGNFIFGKKARFLQIWGIGLLAGFVPLLGELLRMPLVLSKGSTYVSFGLASLMGGADFTSVLFTILWLADAFTIWALVVATIGCSTVFGVSRTKGAIMALTPWILFALFNVGIRSLFPAMMGADVSFF